MLDANLVDQIINHALQQAREAGIALTVSVVDSHGCPLALKRMDGALVVSPKFATAKAYTAATLKMPTSQIAEFAASGKPYYSLPSLSNEFTLIAGGLPIMIDNQVAGAIGIGGSPDPSQDEQIAQAALSAALS